MRKGTEPTYTSLHKSAVIKILCKIYVLMKVFKYFGIWCFNKRMVVNCTWKLIPSVHHSNKKVVFQGIYIYILELQPGPGFGPGPAHFLRFRSGFSPGPGLKNCWSRVRLFF